MEFWRGRLVPHIPTGFEMYQLRQYPLWLREYPLFYLIASNSFQIIIKALTPGYLQNYKKFIMRKKRILRKSGRKLFYKLKVAGIGVKSWGKGYFNVIIIRRLLIIKIININLFKNVSII